MECTTSQFSNVSDIDTMYIISVPLAGGILSLIMVVALAWLRVLSKDKCTEAEAKELQAEKDKLESHSKALEDSPEEKLEIERSIANHILSIADSIQVGAESFLTTEYKFMSVFVVIMLVVVGCATEEWEDTVPSFILGAFLSATCGWIGMSIAVQANVRTAHAARTGLNEALQVAFSSGAVMGLGVTGAGIMGLVILYGIFEGVFQNETRYLAGFGFGASSIALFARVGGGIYTKAADVGADLVGKVEEDIPEDDPRNPATIADNVGDNVGDVAGMGADLFESFVGSIIASIQLAPVQAAAFGDCGDFPANKTDVQALIAVPFWIAGFGMISACLGIFFVRSGKDTGNDHDLQEKLLSIIFRATAATGLLAAGLALFACHLLLDIDTNICWKVFGCNCIGLVAGFMIGQWTEYVTSFSYKPTISIAKKSRIGSAGVIIQGLGIGMMSTVVPVVILVITILACEELSGTYGIGIAAVGMLSTLGITLATDAFGPVADNAGGIAEMAELPPQVRERTDALDALGNTTAATGKGFAIGSAVLTSLALLDAYKTDTNLMRIDVTKSAVLSAASLGACLPYIFAALTMMAVGRSATRMIGEVRRQFEEYNLLAKRPGPIGKPDYKECVDISTRASLWEMLIPGTLAVCAPLIIGFFLGAQAIGADKAKGTKFHKAAVVGDTVGDPFKDTSGPALNILIKLMTMISLVFGKSCFKDQGSFESDRWWIGLIITIVFAVFSVGLTLLMRSWGFGRIPDD